MTDYLCITLLSEPGEAEKAFKARLAAFWTVMLRTRKCDYEKVYAESATFEMVEDRSSRQYLVEADTVDVVLSELNANGIAFEPVDRDETYSKYEATSPDWFQIPH